MIENNSQLDAIKAMLAEQKDFLNEKMQHFEQQMLAKVAQQQEVRSMYDQLYSEMENYREAFFARHFQQPLINDLLLFYDNLDKRLTDAPSAATTEELLHLRTDLEHLLARMDVETYAEALGELPKTFDLKLHKIMRIERAELPEEDGLIVEVLKKGFFWHGKPFRLEQVVIKRK